MNNFFFSEDHFTDIQQKIKNLKTFFVTNLLTEIDNKLQHFCKFPFLVADLLQKLFKNFFLLPNLCKLFFFRE